MVFSHLSMHIVFAKVIPPGIEATMTAFSDTIVTLGTQVIRNLMGYVINV